MGPLPQGCPFHTAPAVLPSSSLSTIPDWPGPKPQPMGGKEPSLRQKTTAGQELSWTAGRGEGAKVHAGEGGRLLGTCPLCNQLQPSFIPAGACPTKRRRPIMPWNLRGAQENRHAGEREDNRQPMASVHGANIEFGLWGPSGLAAPRRCLSPSVFV